METVRFDEGRSSYMSPKESGMLGFVLRIGLVKDREHALRLLALASILFMSLTVFIVVRMNSHEPFNPGQHFVPVYEN